MLLVLIAGCARAPGPGQEPERARPGNIVVSGVPAIPAGAAHELMRYRNVRSAYLMGWAEDGLVIATRFGETTQLHRLKSPLGAREQITFFTEPVRAAFLPTGAGAAGAAPGIAHADARGPGRSGGSTCSQLHSHAGAGRSILDDVRRLVVR